MVISKYTFLSLWGFSSQDTLGETPINTVGSYRSRQGETPCHAQDAALPRPALGAFH